MRWKVGGRRRERPFESAPKGQACHGQLRNRAVSLISPVGCRHCLAHIGKMSDAKISELGEALRNRELGMGQRFRALFALRSLGGEQVGTTLNLMRHWRSETSWPICEGGDGDWTGLRRPVRTSQTRARLLLFYFARNQPSIEILNSRLGSDGRLVRAPNPHPNAAKA